VPKGEESLSGSDKDRKIEGVSEQGILDQRGTKTTPGLRDTTRLRWTIEARY